MSRWFRAYEAALDDPKVQRLPDAAFRGWFNCLCLASRHGGMLPPIADIAFALRLPEKTAEKIIKALVDAELLDETETGLEPHNWSGRQYKSDVSTGRVKRFRDRFKLVPETPSESEADTDTEITTNVRVEREGADALAPPKGAQHGKSGTRIPDAWRPCIAGRAFASERGLDPDATADAFADWWTAASGAKAVKRDWDAAFRTWCRRDSGSSVGPRPASPVRPARGNDAVFEHLAVIANRGGNEPGFRG